MSVRPGLVSAGRDMAESLMVDVATIFRPGAPVFDESDGSLEEDSDVVYSGACRVRAPNVAEQTAVFGEAVATTTRYAVSIPWDASRVHVGDIVQVTTSDDPILTQYRLRVVAVPALTFVMRRKLGAEVIE